MEVYGCPISDYTSADREADTAIIAAAIREAVAAEREACAALVELSAIVEENADDTMAGVYRGRPFRNLAKSIRSRTTDQSAPSGGATNEEHP
jgi:hypothetical protein